MDQVCQCLGSTIAMRGLCESRSECTVYLNDIRGITNQMVEMLVSDDHPTAQGVIDSIVAEAAPDFVQLVKGKIGETVTEKTIIRSVNTSRWRTPHTAIPTQANTYLGEMIYVDESPYLYVFIQYAQLYSDGTGGASESLFVYDLDTGLVLDTFSFDNSVAGFVTVTINTRYVGARRVAALYNSANVSSIEVDEYGIGYYHDVCKPCGCHATHAVCVSFDSTQPIVYSNQTGAQNCGMRLVYSIGCSIEPYICMNLSTFAHGFKYRVAMGLLDEVVASYRINQATLIDEKEMESLFEKMAAGLDRWLGNLTTGSLPKCEICFACSDKVSQAFYVIP